MQRCDAILYAMSEKLKPEADKRAIAMRAIYPSKCKCALICRVYHCRNYSIHPQKCFC